MKIKIVLAGEKLVSKNESLALLNEIETTFKKHPPLFFRQELYTRKLAKTVAHVWEDKTSSLSNTELDEENIDGALFLIKGEVTSSIVSKMCQGLSTHAVGICLVNINTETKTLHQFLHELTTVGLMSESVVEYPTKRQGQGSIFLITVLKKSEEPDSGQYSPRYLQVKPSTAPITTTMLSKSDWEVSSSFLFKNIDCIVGRKLLPLVRAVERQPLRLKDIAQVAAISPLPREAVFTVTRKAVKEAQRHGFDTVSKNTKGETYNIPLNNVYTFLALHKLKRETSITTKSKNAFFPYQKNEISPTLVAWEELSPDYQKYLSKNFSLINKISKDLENAEWYDYCPQGMFSNDATSHQLVGNVTYDYNHFWILPQTYAVTGGLRVSLLEDNPTVFSYELLKYYLNSTVFQRYLKGYRTMGYNDTPEMLCEIVGGFGLPILEMESVEKIMSAESVQYRDNLIVSSY